MANPLNWFSQVVSVTRFNLLTLHQRKGSSATAIFGIAGVVAVMVSVLSIGQGILRTMESSAAPENVIILRSGANTEMMSGLSGESANIIAEGPGITRNEAGAMASPELFVVINLPMRSTGTDANVPMRGVRQQAFNVRQDFHIVEGRPFAWGLNEIIVGVGANHEFAGLEVGSSIEVGQERWAAVVPEPIYRPESEPSPIDNDMFQSLESVAKRMYPDATVIPSMSTGATDMAQVRSMGVPSYGIGPVRSIEEMNSGNGAHGDNERVSEEAMKQLVQFLWYTIIDIAATK